MKKSDKPTGNLSIITGEYRGRKLYSPDLKEEALRPTTGMVREALFNSLHLYVNWQETTVLDLFCGTGALGLEALSRGAKRATFVDTDTQWVEKNIAHLKVNAKTPRCAAIRADALTFTPHKAPQNTPQVIFADPPYKQNFLDKLLPHITTYAPSGTFLLLEAERYWLEQADLNGFETLRHKTYGKTETVILRKG